MKLEVKNDENDKTNKKYISIMFIFLNNNYFIIIY